MFMASFYGRVLRLPQVTTEVDGRNGKPYTHATFPVEIMCCNYADRRFELSCIHVHTYDDSAAGCINDLAVGSTVAISAPCIWASAYIEADGTPAAFLNVDAATIEALDTAQPWQHPLPQRSSP